jgi:hypothetical protein
VPRHRHAAAPVTARTWWIASLFSVGSLCFALGPVPAVVSWLGPRSDSMVYVVGAVFFTTAAALSFLDVVDGGHGRGVDGRRPERTWWQPHSSDWWADGVQLVGTLAFNVTTTMALAQNWTVRQQNVRVWVPDAVGSVCFLVSSGIAMVAAAAVGRRFRADDTAWWVAVFNLAGSVAFGLSALGAFVLPATGDLAAPKLDALGTSVGGVCFLVASVLLIPEAREAGT